MAYTTKKFLDQTGLERILGKLQDYPDNEILGVVINAIDDTKADINHTHTEYQTAAQVTNAITNALGNITEFSISVLSTLPTSGETGVFYFIPNSGSAGNVYDEYVWVNNTFEKIGSTEIDLSNYLQTEDIAAWAKAANKPTYTSAEVGALPSSTAIPSKVSDLTNDAGYISSYTETDPVFAASAAHNITAANISAWNNKSDFSGSYNDLTNKPTIPAATTVTQTLTSGTKIGEVNGTSLYAPATTSVNVTAVQTSGTLIATINGTNIYAPSYVDADNIAY